MNSTERAEGNVLRSQLWSRLDSIVEHWYHAIVQTSYSSLDSAQVREHVAAWTQEILNLLTTESFDQERAASIGEALAALHYLEPEALNQTQDVLSHDLVEGLPPEQAAAVYPKLVPLLTGIAFGFYRLARKTILAEQEEVRSILVNELAKTARALQESRDTLELRVQERTEELETLYEELQAQILERERMAQALGESEVRYRTVLESIHDGVYTLDTEGRFTFVNRVMAQRGGHPIEWFLGRKFTAALREEDKKEAQEKFEAVMRGETIPIFEMAYRTASGNLQWGEVNTTALWENGRIVGVHGVSRDITERKKIEEIKDNLIRDVSHELRTPLAKLRMGLDLLNEVLEVEEIDRARATRIAGVVRGNVERLLRTVEAMLDLSSLEAGRIVYTMEEVEPAGLVQDVILDMQPLAVVKGLELKADLPATLPAVNADREKLFRVLANLVDNAIKFTEEGAITLSATEAPGELVFVVHDPGLGILPENLERIFERFYQEKTRFHGVGVGLAICKAIVEAHGGRIWAESPGRGAGSTFRFTLPT